MLRVQAVRYGGGDGPIVRMVSSVVAAAVVARADRPGLTVTLALGDGGGPGGPSEVLGRGAVSELTEIAAAGGVALEHVAFGANLGHGGGQNRLFSQLDGTPGEPDVVVICNPDTYLGPTCLAFLLACLEDRSVGIAEARQLPLEHPKPFDLATGDTPWASGCLMALPAKLYRSLGGFEEAFFLHGDDVDLSWRVRLSGHRVVHVPAASVFHDKRPTDSGFPPPTPEEEYQAVLARFLLAHRAERRDVIDWWLEWSDRHASVRQAEATAAFRQLVDSGDLPTTYRQALGVDATAVNEVAAFHGGEYAAHRF